MHRMVSLPAIVGLLLTPVVFAQDQPVVPSITVEGMGDVQVQPDMASVTVGVTTDARSASEAVQQNGAQMAELIKTLKAQNVADKDVQTSNFSVSPRRNYDPQGKQPPEIVGYTATNQATVKVRDVSKLGAILDAVVKAGGNQVHGIAFSVADPKPHLDQARRKAIEDAFDRAKLYAEAAGVPLGKPRLIREQMASVPRPMMAAMQMERADVPIATGEQTISASVSVTFAIDE